MTRRAVFEAFPWLVQGEPVKVDCYHPQHVPEKTVYIGSPCTHSQSRWIRVWTFEDKVGSWAWNASLVHSLRQQWPCLACNDQSLKLAGLCSLCPIFDLVSQQRIKAQIRSAAKVQCGVRARIRLQFLMFCGAILWLFRGILVRNKAFWSSKLLAPFSSSSSSSFLDPVYFAAYALNANLLVA